VLLSITKSFLAVTRARSKSHTTPDMGVSKLSTNIRSVSQILTDALLSTTVYFLAVTGAPQEGYAPLTKDNPRSACTTTRYLD